MSRATKSWMAVGLFCLGSSACLLNCGGDDDPVPGGDLVVDWTIAGSKRGADCDLTQTDTVNVNVLDDRGSKVNVGADVQDCGAFGTSFGGAFAPGNYQVEVTMLHPDGSASSTTARVNARVFSRETTFVPVDFPPDSFF